MVGHFGGALGVGFLEPIRGPNLLKKGSTQNDHIHACTIRTGQERCQLEASFSQTCFTGVFVIIDHEKVSGKKKNEIKGLHPNFIFSFFFTFASFLFSRLLTSTLPSSTVTTPLLYLSHSPLFTLSLPSQLSTLHHNVNNFTATTTRLTTRTQHLSFQRNPPDITSAVPLHRYILFLTGKTRDTLSSPRACS